MSLFVFIRFEREGKYWLLFFYINGDESLILGVFIASIMEQMTAMMAVIQRNKQRMLIFAYLSFLLLYIPIPSSPPLCMGTFISQSLVGR